LNKDYNTYLVEVCLLNIRYFNIIIQKKKYYGSENYDIKDISCHETIVKNLRMVTLYFFFVYNIIILIRLKKKTIKII